METLVVDMFGEPLKDVPDRNVRAVRSLYESPKTGVFSPESDSTRFYVLGLAPNAARIAVRFWSVSTVTELARNLRQHFDDLSIVRPSFEPPYLSISRLLKATALLEETKNIQPNLAGDVVRSALNGAEYPHTLLQATLRRARAEQARQDRGTTGNVTYARASIIKACLNRHVRLRHTREKELQVSLDKSNSNRAYRLGRLFAVLEKIQEETSPGINATIRDRFYGGASSTPVAVFSTLLKLKNHHLAKLENRGRVVNFEKLVGEILGGISEFPAQMSLADQGRFAIGYYHQRQAFFTKSDAST
jgi:CRISPR-associated protein Csd1